MRRPWFTQRIVHRRRVHHRDLYRLEYPDQGGNGNWYRPLVDMLTVVTIADQQRFGVMPTGTFATTGEGTTPPPPPADRVNCVLCSCGFSGLFGRRRPGR